MALEIIRKKDEELIDYLIRLYENRLQYGLSNQDVAALLNKEEDVDYDESRWRKIYQAWENYFSAYVAKRFDNAEGYNSHILNRYDLLRIESEKEKIKFRDQKREFNKMIRNQARFEHLKEVLVENIQALTPAASPILGVSTVHEKELLILLNDIHMGMEVDNRFNKYNMEIAQERLHKVQQRVYDTVMKEGIGLLHIANLGDAIHGIIHSSARLQAEEDVIQQIIKVSELLTGFVKTFLDMGIQVKYYNVVGNHGRAIANKSDVSGSEENFEKLILTIMDASLAAHDNYTSKGCRDGFIEANIAGLDVILTHGNFDNHNNSAYKLPQLLNYVPALIVSGHVHHMLQKDFGATLTEVSPSLSGLDDYATSGRYAGRAGQKMILFEDGEIAATSTIFVK